MSRVCELTGKKAMVGNNVSHAMNRTKRKFDANLIQQNDFVFLNLDCFEQFIQILKQTPPAHKFILLTHNSDQKFYYRMQKELNSDLVLHQ